MVSYPDLSVLGNNSGIGGLLAVPNQSYPYFWSWILFGIWAIITLTLYYKEKESKGRSNILSCMSTGAFAILMLALIGTIIGFISLEIMVVTLVMCLLIIAVWFFSN